MSTKIENKENVDNDTIHNVNVSLRNYLAGNIIQGLLANPKLGNLLNNNLTMSETDKQLAITAYRIADVMISTSNEY